MPRVNVSKGSVSFRALAALIVFLVLTTIIFLNINSFATLCVNGLTDYALTYDKWSGSLLGQSEIRGIILESKKDKLSITAKDVFIDFKLKESIKSMRIVAGCRLQDVAFDSMGEAAKEISEGAASAGEETDMEESISGALTDPFGPGQRYDKITFTLLLGWDKVTLYDFQAYSKEIEIKAKEFTSTLR
jgi:hypothetical protein